MSKLTKQEIKAGFFKRNKFLSFKKEMAYFSSKAVKGLFHLKPGFKFFEGDTEYEVISEPYFHQFSMGDKAIFVDIRYTSSLGGRIIETEKSVCDSNIINGGYNPWQIFFKEEDAKEYSEFIHKHISYDRDDFFGPSINYPAPAKGLFVDESTLKLEIRN